MKVRDNESEWWNSACKEAIKERTKAERLYKKNKGNAELKELYQKKQNDAAMIAIDRQCNSYYTNKLTESIGDSKARSTRSSILSGMKNTHVCKTP